MCPASTKRFLSPPGPPDGLSKTKKQKWRDPVKYRAYQRKYHANRRRAYLLAGWCPDCGADRDSRWKRCVDCRADNNRRTRRSLFRKQEGLR
jgi:hypothetical protein